MFFFFKNSIGESTYQLTDAQDLKHKLSKLGEQADLLR